MRQRTPSTRRRCLHHEQPHTEHPAPHTTRRTLPDRIFAVTVGYVTPGDPLELATAMHRLVDGDVPPPAPSALRERRPTAHVARL